MTWPELRQRWTLHRTAPGAGQLTAAERNAVWDHAIRVAAGAAAQICALAGTNPAAAVDAAWATSDTLHVAAAMLGIRILRQAADAYDRAARAQFGRIAPPTPAGNQLRQAARIMSAFAYLTGDGSLAPVVLITRLAALAEAVAELRDVQRNAAQAAARAAAERLYAAARSTPPVLLRPAPAPAPPPSWPRCPSPSRPRPAARHPRLGHQAPIQAARRRTQAVTATATRPQSLTTRSRRRRLGRKIIDQSSSRLVRATAEVQLPRAAELTITADWSALKS